VTRLRIEVASGGAAAAALEPDGDVVRIGRRAGNDVHVEDRRVALDHALVRVTDDGAVLEDLGSDYGTTIRRRGTRIPLGSEAPSIELVSGDVVELGDRDGAGAGIELRVTLGAETEAPRFVETRPITAFPGAPVTAPRGDPVLRTLCEVQGRIGTASDLAGVLAAVADAVLALVPRATHATVILRDDAATGDDGFVPMLTRVRGPGGLGITPAEPVRVARSVFRKVVRERAAVLAADAPSGELSSESLLGASIRSTIGVPLFQGNEVLGVLQLDNRAAPAMFTSADVDAIGVLAANASLAVANARLIHRLSRAEEQLERETRFL
jgi:hypothetical protein